MDINLKGMLEISRMDTHDTKNKSLRIIIASRMESIADKHNDCNKIA